MGYGGFHTLTVYHATEIYRRSHEFDSLNRAKTSTAAICNRGIQLLVRSKTEATLALRLYLRLHLLREDALSQDCEPGA